MIRLVLSYIALVSSVSSLLSHIYLQFFFPGLNFFFIVNEIAMCYTSINDYVVPSVGLVVAFSVVVFSRSISLVTVTSPFCLSVFS